METTLTALDAYQRLEASGVWQPGPSEQRLNVIVSLGSASLTITDLKDTALAHWSLPAVERINPGQAPAIYRTAPDAEDRLEILDDEMVEAIEQVRRAVSQNRPQRGRLRGFLWAGIALAGCAALLFWAPSAIRGQAAMVLPQASHAALGAAVLTEVQRIAGVPCQTGQGQSALDRLAAKVAPGAQVLVMPDAVETMVLLPGQRVLLGRSVVEDHDTPFVAAGYLVEAQVLRRNRDAVDALLEDASLVETGRLLTSGTLSQRALGAHAERLMAEPPPVVDQTTLAAELADMRLPAAPLAYAKDISGDTTSELLRGGVDLAAAAPVMSDGDWVALQGICGE